MDLEHLEKFSKIKGLNLIGTGDFSHPLWFKELKANLKETAPGIFHYRDKTINFILQNEICNIYEQDGKTRKIHNVLIAPSFEIVEQINDFLKKYGNLSSDGRPIFNNLTCVELVENLMKISKDIGIISAHIWTPWFGLFGSKTGFDSVEECYKDQTKNILALETGLSSDPAMNWRLSSLDKFTLVSNSDCHSPWPWRLGREANILELKHLDYNEIFSAIKEKDKKRFLFTIEVDPAYGKYHWDGHRNCGVFLKPKDAISHQNFCPICKKKLTIGVEHRVEELADRPENFVPENSIPFKRLIPLAELLAAIYNTQPFSKRVWEESTKLVKEFGTELNVLLDTNYEKLKLLSGEKIADIIIRNREAKLKIQPGYDGVYGKLILEEKEFAEKPQKNLKEFL